MIVQPIHYPLEDEGVVGVYPVMAPSVETGWHRRLNLFTGRALSDLAMIAEQDGRAGRLALRGRTVSPGVVFGLEVDLEDGEGNGEGGNPQLHLSAGLGMSIYGEDVVIPKPLNVDPKTLRVYAPVDLLDEIDPGPRPLTPKVFPRPLKPRRLGPALEELIADGIHPPRAGILVLQPVVVEMIGEFDPEDPCEQVPQDFAFEDQQLVDGSRLILYAWPTERLFLPALDQRWRNRLAYRIFEAERRLEPDEVLPWEAIGVPIGLIAFDRTWDPLFVDRYSVVRGGGKSITRTQALSEVGTPFLWQARMQQFCEQLATQDPVATPIDEIAKSFRYLPPAGLLPKNAIDARGGENNFFPVQYKVSAAPVPIEQLDAAMESSASLVHYDTSVRDSVRVLVPVPQVYYEPGLLAEEIVDPEFQETIDAFVDRRGKWLKRRLDVREMFSALVGAIRGEAPEFPDPDPNALEEEEIAVDPIDPEIPELQDPEQDYGTEHPNGARIVSSFKELREYLKDHTPLRNYVSVPFKVPLDIEQDAPEGLADRIQYDDEMERLIYRGLMTREELHYIISLEGLKKGAKENVKLLYVLSQDDELSQLDALGLHKFIDFLEERIKRADDKVDLGFVKAQTDIYRLRQLMLGNVTGSRLATSPVLATIAQGETAIGTTEQINEYLTAMKLAKPIGNPNPGNPGTSDNPGGGGGNPTGLVTASNPGFSGTTGSGSTSANVPNEGTASFLMTSIPATAKPTETEMLQFKTVDSGMLFGIEAATAKDVFEQSPIVGKAYDFRNLAVAKRLEDSKAAEAKTYSVATMIEVYTSLSNLNIYVDDIEVCVAIEVANDGTITRGKATLGDIRVGDTSDLIDIPDPSNGDEAAFFSIAVDTLEQVIACIRRVEARVHIYRKVVETCQKVLNEIEEFTRLASARLRVIGEEVAEARHDVAVARALLAEEQQRVATVNARREKILEEHVHFLAYHRPRVAYMLMDGPVRTIDPGLVEDPVPACLQRAVAVPPDLQAMVDLFRDVPLKWLRFVPQLLDRLDRLDLLHNTIKTAVQRSKMKYLDNPIPSLIKTGGGFSQSIAKVYTAQQQVVVKKRMTMAKFDVATLAGLSWKQTRDQAEESLSLGDLMDAGKIHSYVAQRASKELENIASVATCLYGAMGDVKPVLRLDWAERLSQYDEPVNLRSLSSLPRWEEIEFLERKEMQSFVDWLFQRVDVKQSEAVSMISDLVRICILMASHAPVKKIIAGHIHEATAVSLGGRVNIVVDPSVVRVGMNVMMFAGSNVVAQGVVEDISAGLAAARVIEASAPSVQLEQGAKVQFAEQATFYGNPLSGGWS